MRQPAISASWISQNEAIAALAIAGDAIQPGAFGVEPGTFAVIAPGAEWSVRLAPLGATQADVGPIIAALCPVIFVVADPTQPAAIRSIPSAPGTLHLRVTGPDLVTPVPPGVVFAVSATLLRRVGPPV